MELSITRYGTFDIDLIHEDMAALGLIVNGRALYSISVLEDPNGVRVTWDGATGVTEQQVGAKLDSQSRRESTVVKNKNRQSQTLTQLKTQAAGAVGKSVFSLNNTEVRALMALLAWKAGAIDNDLRVLNPDLWL